MTIISARFCDEKSSARLDLFFMLCGERQSCASSEKNKKTEKREQGLVL